MNEPITPSLIESKLLTLQGQSVLLDADIAAFYGVETREISQAVKRNPDKFPPGYILQLTADEQDASRSQIVILNDEADDHTEVIENCDKLKTEGASKSSRSKISTLNDPPQGRGHNLKYPPKAFTEKGLYMLATILKSPRAVQTTLAIVETYAKIREFARTVTQITETPPSDKATHRTLLEKGGAIMADILDDNLQTTGTETTIELNLAVLKVKRTVKRKA